MEKLSERKTVLIIFMVSLILRVIFIFTLKNQFYFDDEFEYYRMVENFLSGKGLIVGENLKSFRPPLYPLFLSFFYFLGLNLFSIRIIQAIISSITVIFIYFLGKNIFNNKIGFFSSLIASFYPFFIFYTGFLLTETLFIFLIVLTLHFLIQTISEKENISAIKSGIFLGLSALCRPTMELFFPFIILTILGDRRKDLKDRWKKVLLVSLFFSFTVSPWIVRNYIIFKKFIPGTTMGGWVFWEGNNPKSFGGPCQYFPENVLEMEEIARDKFLYKKTIEVIRKNPKRFIWLLKNKFIRFWNVVPNASQFQKPLYRILSVFSFGILLPFFILGFVMTFKNKKAIIMHILIIFFTIFHMIFLSSIRYRVAIEPFYIIFAVYGLIYLFSKFPLSNRVNLTA